MPRAKVSRNRSRTPSRVRGSKTKFRAGTARVRLAQKREKIPSELEAPITRKVERQLEQLIFKFGEKKVYDVLGPLVTQCKWNDWQCVANAIRRIARRQLS